jgi:hypothetical protein
VPDINPSKYSLENFNIENGSQKLIKRNWPALSTRALMSYLPRNEPALRKGKYLAEYPTRPIYIDSDVLDLKNIKRDVYKLKSSRGLTLQINKNRIKAMKDDILRHRIKERESSPV